MVAIEELASSKVRLKIANHLSSRPATLSELAEVTGISVQGVLKHLTRIAEEGILKEELMKKGKYLKQRKLYFIEKRKIADYSDGDLLLAALGRVDPQDEPGVLGDAFEVLDWLAQDIIILKRRGRDLTHRLWRVMDEIAEDEGKISGILDGAGLDPDEKQIAYLIFTEDTPERAKATLRDHYGCRDPDAAMDAVTAKLRRRRS